MRTLFIPARLKARIDENSILKQSRRLPKELAVAYSVQYYEPADKIREILSKKHRITGFIQVLGCSKPVFPKNTKAILLISDGKFHSRNFYINQYHKFDVSGLTLDKFAAAVPIRLKYDVEVAGSYSFLDRFIDTYLTAKPFGAASDMVQRVPIAGKVLTGADRSLYAVYFRFRGLCGYQHRGTKKAARLERLTYKELPKAHQELFKKSFSLEKAPG